MLIRKCQWQEQLLAKVAICNGKADLVSREILFYEGVIIFLLLFVSK